ncbi:hypothetical protein EJB05_26064, partial [Eragrostis curvula]
MAMQAHSGDVETVASGRSSIRAIRGPAGRVPPSGETAIERALRQAEARPAGAPVFRPEVGTAFDTCDEGYEFYNLFSWEKGFGIRYGRSRTNSASYRTRQDIVCACAGNSPVGINSTQRSGCRAMIRLLRSDDHGWYVARFVETHNHQLSQGCGETRQWNSHNRIDPVARDFIRNVRANNVSLSRLYGVIGGTLGYGPAAPFTKQSLRGLCARMSQDSIVDDISKTMKLLGEMQGSDPDLSVCIDTEEGRVRSILWCNGKNKVDYCHFGDVVTFDTTYRTNLYNMPFGLFVGVNNHFQSIVFGAVLLTHETTESFEWSFSTFQNIMNGKCPQTILTDQCAAMEAALKTTMPGTRHRWCRWHVLRNAKEKLGGVYSKFCGFKREFHSLVTDIIDPVEFESKWADIISRYELVGNPYIERLYTHREMWAKPYFTGIFCGGMTSTQRSESANHLLKSYIPRSAPMHMFVTQYNAMLRSRDADEDRENHVSRQKRRHIRIGVPIEWNAASIYTRTMFDKFSNELYASGAYALIGNGSANRFTVRPALQQQGDNVHEHSVVIRVDNTSYICDCGLFEHMGMPCRHILKVYTLVLKRWTLAAREAIPGMNEVRIGTNSAMIEPSTMKNLLYLAAMDLLAEASMNAHSFDASMRAIREAKHSVRIINQCHTFGDAPTTRNVIPEGVTLDFGQAPVVPERVLLPPTKVKSRGRPPSTRLKSRSDYYGARPKRTRNVSECYVDPASPIPVCIGDGGQIEPALKRQPK